MKNYQTVRKEIQEKFGEKINNQFHKRTDFLSFVLMITIILVVAHFCALAETDGESMLPTLGTHEVYFILKGEYVNVDKLDTNDIVMVQYEDDILVKRFIAKKGDTIEVIDGVAYVNDEVVVIDGIDRSDWVKGESYINREKRVVEGDLYLLGDNMPHSMDSRHVGDFNKEDVRGKLLFRVAPLFR